MSYTAAVITMSDKGSKGERKDTAGPALCEMLEKDGWEILYKNIIPDDFETIKKELIVCCDEKKIVLVVTTGGTGFSKRDITPEATKAVIEREAPGIPEAMRLESLKVTSTGCLSRATAGLRGDTLIINCPGSEKAARECLGAVLPAIKHGVDILRGDAAECAAPAGHNHHHH